MVNREQLINYLIQSKNKEISELVIHVFFMEYGYEYDNDINKKDIIENEEK